MEILKCTTQHQIEELAQLAKQIWHEYFINIISHERIDYMVEKYQSLTALKKAIQQEGYTYFLCLRRRTANRLLWHTPRRNQAIPKQTILTSICPWKTLCYYIIESCHSIR